MPALPVSPSSGRFMRAGVLALTVGVFAAVVAVVTWRLRGDLREQILQGFARNLAAVASMQLENYTEETGIPVEEVPSGVYAAVAKIAKLRGVSGYRVYEGDGRLAGDFGVASIDAAPPQRIWERVAGGAVVARLHDQGRDEAEAIFLPAAARVVDVWIPLHRSGTPRLLGAAQFLMEESDIMAELRRHDGRLWMQASIAWAAGSLVLVLGVGGALRRLDAANRTLRARSEELLRANRELVLAAKTSAVGAVTAHLMHELKTPIAGLESIVGGRTEANRGGDDFAEASELTRRLRTMVNDIVGVLRDEQNGAEFELTSAEVLEVVAGKVQREAAERGVRFSTAAAAEGALGGRRANLAILVLRNLVQNALEATPTGGSVMLTARKGAEGAVEFYVDDTGSGLPGNIRERLFQPVTSGKKGGSGLGLALSYQIAQQAGGRLELVRSDERGTSFRLVLAAEA